jgi:hypothetical protein
MLRLLFTATLLFLLSRAPATQSLYTFDPSLSVTEVTGPPSGPCLYPDGPVNSAFFAVPGACPSPLAFAAPLGDVAVDPVTDTIYVTDGTVVAEYSRFGAYLGAGLPPIPGLTGLAVGGGFLWITDGFVYGAVPLAPIACPAGALAFAVGPFPVPIAAGFFGGPIGDIDFEATSGSLTGVDGFGTVVSFMPAPFPVFGPYGSYTVAPIGCLAPVLTGIAFDRAMPGSGIVYVTDGAAIARMLPGAIAAPPTFYAPLPCVPAPTFAPIVGLAFAGRQVTYGVGADTGGFPPPSIGSLGQSYIGSPAYGVTLTGSVPGGLAFLRYSGAPSCPATPVLGLPIYPSFPLSPAATVTVGAGGTAAFSTAIPPIFPAGLSVHLQWIVLTGASIQVTPGAELTLIAP